MTPPAAAATVRRARVARAAAPARVAAAAARLRARSARARAAPRVRAPQARARPLARPRCAALDALAARTALLDRLIRGRIVDRVIAFALIGIVTLQLGLLKLNGGIGRALEREAQLQRENAALSIENSELASGERVESQAARLGMSSCRSAALRFLTADRRARRRARRGCAEQRRCHAAGDQRRAQPTPRARARRNVRGGEHEARRRRAPKAAGSERGTAPSARRRRARKRRRPAKRPRRRATPGGERAAASEAAAAAQRVDGAGAAPAGAHGRSSAARARRGGRSSSTASGAIFGLFFLLLVLACGRTMYLGVLRGGTLRKAASDEQLTDEAVTAPRGTITDRNGVELAVSEPAQDISADPVPDHEPARASRRLAPLLGQTQASVLRKALASAPASCTWRARCPRTQAEAVLALKIPGITGTPVMRRVYPRGTLAAQVLGVVGTEGTGPVGPRVLAQRAAARARRQAAGGQRRARPAGVDHRTAPRGAGQVALADARREHPAARRRRARRGRPRVRARKTPPRS